MNLIGIPWQRCSRRKLTPLVKARLRERELELAKARRDAKACARWKERRLQ